MKVIDLSLIQLQKASLALADRATQKIIDREELISRWIGTVAA